MDVPAIGALYDKAPCALLMTAIDGTILQVNATFCHWVGRDKASVIGKLRLQQLFTMGGRIFHQTHWAPLLQMQGSVAEVKLEIVHSAGHTIPMLLNAVRRKHPAGTFDELAMVVVNDRHKYEQELLQARAALAEINKQLSHADKRKDEFLATLAHELRNPLAPMRNVIQILKKIDSQDPKVTWANGVLDRQVQHMTHLVDDLLEVARIAQGKIELRKERMQLESAIQVAVEAVLALMQERGHELDLQLPSASLEIDGDPTRIAQIVQNLLNNAAKYTPPGGKISLTVGLEGNAAVIRVKDCGIGIAQEHLARVFDMFSQIEPASERTQGGLGIGLALVRGLVELHGGKVVAESAGVGRGSEFVVCLPVCQVMKPAGSVSVPDEADSDTSARILVVDDNKDAAQSLALLLELRGHHVKTAHDGANALLLAPGFLPKIILLDIGLPDSNGYEMARRIREQAWGRNVLLVALTGWGQNRDKIAATQAGFDHHLTKPLVLHDLIAILDRAAKAT